MRERGLHRISGTPKKKARGYAENLKTPFDILSLPHKPQAGFQQSLIAAPAAGILSQVSDLPFRLRQKFGDDNFQTLIVDLCPDAAELQFPPDSRLVLGVKNTIRVISPTGEV